MLSRQAVFALCTASTLSDNTSCLTALPVNLLQAGWLAVGGESHPLYKGMNVIGRHSDDENRNRERVVDWPVQYGGRGPVSVLLLRFDTISSKHAIIRESENHAA